MTRQKPYRAKEEAEIGEKIENFFAFVQDVLDDPSTLDRIADKSTIELTPVERKDPLENYTTETRRFAVKVTRTPTRSAMGPSARFGYVARRPGQSFVRGKATAKPTGNPAYGRRATGQYLHRDTKRGTVVRPGKRPA